MTNEERIAELQKELLDIAEAIRLEGARNASNYNMRKVAIVTEIVKLRGSI